MAKPQDVLKSLSQIGHRIGENIEKTCQFGLTDPEGPKDRDLDPGLKLVWSISTKARAHARGRGVPSKADIISNLSKGGCVNLRTEGCQKSENFADIIIWKPPKVQKKILSGRQVTEACN